MAPSSVTVKQGYHGIRKRKWGKWVSEIREPGKKTKIWLGSFESPEKAAVAYDVAALSLKGHQAWLNFPDSVDLYPRPVTSSSADIRSAAVEAARNVVQLRRRKTDELNELISSTAAVREMSSDVENGDWPKMWAELAEAMLLSPPRISEIAELDDLPDVSLWDSSFSNF